MFQITGTCLEFESRIKKPIENQTVVYYKQTAEMKIISILNYNQNLAFYGFCKFEFLDLQI